MIEVIQPGPLTLIQDLRRPGLAALGVGPSGAADRSSLRLANRLVGNGEEAAALEVTLGGLRVRFLSPTTIALTGASCPIHIGCHSRVREAAMNGPVHVAAGTTMRLASPTSGVRTYVAVRGGIAATPVLGSSSSDTLSGIGPPPLTTGQQIAVGPPPHGGR